MLFYINEELLDKKQKLERELRDNEAQRRLYSEAGLANLENDHPTFALDAYRLATKYDNRIKEILKELDTLEVDRASLREKEESALLTKIYKELGVKRYVDDTNGYIIIN